MLIKDYHSGNKVDYYDTANYGVDTGIVFNRADVTLDSPAPLRTLSLRIPRGGLVNIQSFYIFFAGKVYPGLRIMKVNASATHEGWSVSDRLTDHIPDYTNKYKKYATDFYYNYEDAKAAFNKVGKLSACWGFDGTNNESKLYDHFHNINPEWTDWLIANKIVVGYFLSEGPASHRTIIQEYNGAFLKYWEFYTVKDAFTANQDIANYVGGVLLDAANPMIELNDKHKILKAGFDFKTSFRKAKQKS